MTSERVCLFISSKIDYNNIQCTSINGNSTETFIYSYYEFPIPTIKARKYFVFL